MPLMDLTLLLEMATVKIRNAFFSTHLRHLLNQRCCSVHRLNAQLKTCIIIYMENNQVSLQKNLLHTLSHTDVHTDGIYMTII